MESGICMFLSLHQQRKLSTISKIKYVDSLSPSFEMLPDGNNIPFRVKFRQRGLAAL